MNFVCLLFYKVRACLAFIGSRGSQVEPGPGLASAAAFCPVALSLASLSYLGDVGEHCPRHCCCLMTIIDLRPELHFVILKYLDGLSLATAEVACQTFRDHLNGDMWQALVLHSWGWLLQDVPFPFTWK